MTARARLIAVATILLVGAVGVIASTQTWFTVSLVASVSRSLTVSGAAAIAVLAPLSLAVLALGAALSIVGTVLRYAFGVLTVGIAAALLYLTAQAALMHPVSVVASTVTTATGIAGNDAVARLVSGVSNTPWPFVTVAACVVLVAVGVFVLVTARTWRASGRRYRTDAQISSPRSGPLDAVDSWDGLSRGEDPTADSDPR